MAQRETEILQQSLLQHQALQEQLQTLLNTLQPLLEQPEFSEQLAEAESYLYDAKDALEDFAEDCKSCLEAWQEAQS